MLALKNRIYFIIFFLFFSWEILSAEKQENFNNTVDVDIRITAVTLADLKIGEERVEKTVTWRLNFLSPKDLEERKDELLKKLCREVGADLLIDPQFVYSKKILGGGSLTVSGYPASYINFRNMTQDEIEAFIKDEKLNKNTVIIVTHNDGDGGAP